MAKLSNNIPPSASQDGKKNWFDAFEAPRIGERTAIMLSILACGVAVIEGLALVSMLPLVKLQPYFVEVETSTGKVSASTDRRLLEFKPEDRHVRYFLNQWVQNFLTIDPRTRENLLPASYALMRGDGVGKWMRFIETEDRTISRIVESPTLRREVKVVSMSFISEGVALIRVKTKETGQAVAKNKAITLFFATVPPDTDEKILANPIGLYITDFTINDELI